MSETQGTPSIETPTTGSPPGPSPEYDAIVVGSGYGGLISAAVLAREGKRVVMVDEADRIGCVGGSSFYRGYWLPWVRNWETAHGTGDIFMLMGKSQLYGKEAERRAGAEIDYLPQDISMRLHLTPDGEKVGQIILYDDSDPQTMLLFGTQLLGLPQDLMPRFQEEMGRIAALDPEEHRGLTFDEYLPSIPEPEVRSALSTLATVQFSVPAGETSVGRFAGFIAAGASSWRVNDSEVGGMQGVMEPYARAIRKHGGEILLGRQCLEVIVEQGAVRGAVIADEHGIATELRAPEAICNHLCWQVFDLIDESLFPADFASNARALEQYAGDTGCLNVGLSRLPTRSTDGRTEDLPAWNRVVVGPEKDYMSGWFIPSLIEERTAPEGKHLLHIAWGTSGPASPVHRPFRCFAEVKSKVDRVFAYAKAFYTDLEDCIEWANYKWCKAPTTAGFYWKRIPRAPVEAPGIDGLYFVSNSAEVEGMYQDIEAHAALVATERILERLG